MCPVVLLYESLLVSLSRPSHGTSHNYPLMWGSSSRDNWRNEGLWHSLFEAYYPHGLRVQHPP
jgi:hypothetical protein